MGRGVSGATADVERHADDTEAQLRGSLTEFLDGIRLCSVLIPECTLCGGVVSADTEDQLHTWRNFMYFLQFAE